MNEWDKVRELLEKFDTAMLVTQGEDGGLHARPMAIADVDESGHLWFITGKESGKVHEIREDSRVNVICQDGRRIALSISGGAALLRDAARTRQLWKESFKVWFPNGPEDPGICLIQVRPIEAEYWDASGWKGIKYLFSAATAYARGEPPILKDQHGTATGLA